MLAGAFFFISLAGAAYGMCRIGQTIKCRLPWSAYLDQILCAGAAALMAGLIAWGIGFDGL